MTESSLLFSLLKEQSTVLAEILAYIIRDFQDLAKLRLVSKDWNTRVLPYCLKNGGFLKNCSRAQHRFVEELVRFGEDSYAGRLYDVPDPNVFDYWGQQRENGEDSNAKWEHVNVVATRMLVISGYQNMPKTTLVAATQNTDYIFPEETAARFSDYSFLLSEIQEWNAFQEIANKAVSEGMFQDLQSTSDETHTVDPTLKKKIYRDQYLPVIMTLLIPSDNVQLVEIGSTKVVFLTAKVPKDLTAKVPKENEDEDKLFPFMSHRQGLTGSLSTRNPSYPTFVGYNAYEETENMIRCLVPMAFLDEEIDELLYEWGDTVSHLPLDCLWSRCQEQHIQEGIAIADGIVPHDLHTNLISQIDAVAGDQIADYHPHSNEIVRDIVHPALYPYVKGVSPLLKSEEEIHALSYPTSVEPTDRLALSAFDYWRRPYEASAKYQWLPTYFDINKDGNVKICDYINNLVPRSKYEELYSLLAQLFSQALPMIESVYGYCRVVKEEHLRSDDDEMDFNDDPLEDVEEVQSSFRGKELQVVTKIVDYELAPGQTYEGVWHVEGMSHEEIVATAIYFLDRDDDIKGGAIQFKRAFHKQEAEYIFSTIDQVRPREVERIIDDGLQPLGQVETFKRRLLVFPNSHVHKVTKLENISSESGNNEEGKKKKRRIIVFFLINPERRIISTREVPMQQEHVGGTMRRTDALEHRLALMKERK